MFITEAKHLKTEEQKTQIKVSFGLPLDVDLMQLFQIEANHGYLAFNPDEFKAKVEAAMKQTKIGIREDGQSKSKVLRGVLFRLHEEDEEYEGGYEDYYNEKMDKIINHFKSHLTDER